MKSLARGLVIVGLAVEPCSAQDYSLTCTPTFLDNAAKDPIVRIMVEHHGQEWSIIRIARSGTQYDRSTEYSMSNVAGAPSARWRGAKLSKPNFTMVGLVDTDRDPLKYVEILIEKDRDGAIVEQSEAECFPNQRPSGNKTGD